MFCATINIDTQVYERGEMQPIYVQYRDMKRDIRHQASLDIQRCFRGFVSRQKLLRGRPEDSARPLTTSAAAAMAVAMVVSQKQQQLANGEFCDRLDPAYLSS